MRREFISAGVFAVSVMAAQGTLAQGNLRHEIPDGTSSQPTVAAPDPVAGVATQIAPTQVDLASASLSAKEKGTEFRATFIPAKIFDAGYVHVLSESKIVLTSNGSLTRIGYGVAYNPFALRSSRAAAIVRSQLHQRRCGEAWGDALDALDAGLKSATEAYEVAKRDFNAAESALQDVSGSANPTAHRARTTRHTAKAALDQAKERLEQAKRAKKNGTDAANAVQDECNSELTVAEWRQINSGWTPLVNLNLAIDIYPFGKGPDPDDDTKEARLEPFGGVRADGGLVLKPEERFSLELWGQLRRGRASGDPKTNLATYAGGGITASGVIWAFLQDSTRSADYVQTGFIAGLAIGASGQYARCWGKTHCDKMRTESTSITPFVDVRVKPEVQFRLSAPITTYSAVGEDGMDVAPTLTFASAVAAL